MARILLIDDDMLARDMLRQMLERAGYDVVEAAGGREGLQHYHATAIDLIITDILMPHMDGFSLVRRLRAEPLLSGIPVIFQTANYHVSEIHKLARASGVQHILRKAAEPHDILRAVNESLKRPTTPGRLPQTGQLQREHLELLADKLYQKVSELEKANDRLRNLSLTDALTGLNNRRGFMILATGLLKFARRAAYSVCLLYIDLDSLKYINDTFGHAAGDAAITQFSRILTDTFRDSDVIGRLGGDEFVAMIADAAESDLASIQTRLHSNVDAYNLRSDPGQSLAFSLGVIRVEPKSTITMEELLAEADAAMYQHKISRRRTA